MTRTSWRRMPPSNASPGAVTMPRPRRRCGARVAVGGLVGDDDDPYRRVALPCHRSEGFGGPADVIGAAVLHDLRDGDMVRAEDRHQLAEHAGLVVDAEPEVVARADLADRHHRAADR